MVATYNDSGDTYDDTDFLWEGLDPTLKLSVLVGTQNSAADLTGDIQWSTFRATDTATNARGQIRFRVEQPLSALTTVEDQALVRIVDHALNTESQRGLIVSRKPIGRPMYDAVEITAEDLGVLLDDTYIVFESRPTESMQTRITHLWTTYRPPGLDNTLAFVASFGGTLPAQEISGTSLRQAIEETITQASTSADYFIDALGRLHVFNGTETNDAPFDIDNDAPGAGEVAAEELSIEYDTSGYANRVYVAGGTPEGSGFFVDSAAIDAVDGIIRTTTVQAPECTTEAQAQAVANLHLARLTTARVRGSFEITDVNGWQAGQNVLITDSAKGLTAQSFRIVRVTKSVVRPGTTTPAFRYVVEFGAVLPGIVSARRIIGQPLTGQLSYGSLGGDGRVHVQGDGVLVTD